MVRILAVIGLGASCLLLADDNPGEKLQISKTEHFEFPAGGTLRLMNSIGVLNVEAWDRPEVEITTIKSTKIAYHPRNREKEQQELDRVHVTVERHGDELVITTEFPRYAVLSPYPLTGETKLDLEYRVKAPSNVRLIANHDVGEVNIDGLLSDIHVTLRQGDILLHLPEEGRYNIDAKSDVGNVNSDFPGKERRRPWLLGHRIVNENSPAAHNLTLRVGVGDIIILKARLPKPPEPLGSGHPANF
jgi:Putative adhesin